MWTDWDRGKLCFFNPTWNIRNYLHSCYWTGFQRAVWPVSWGGLSIFGIISRARAHNPVGDTWRSTICKEMRMKLDVNLIGKESSIHLRRECPTLAGTRLGVFASSAIVKIDNIYKFFNSDPHLRIDGNQWRVIAGIRHLFPSLGRRSNKTRPGWWSRISLWRATSVAGTRTQASWSRLGGLTTGTFYRNITSPNIHINTVCNTCVIYHVACAA